jgi:hypothetical protein
MAFESIDDRLKRLREAQSQYAERLGRDKTNRDNEFNTAQQNIKTFQNENDRQNAYSSAEQNRKYRDQGISQIEKEQADINRQLEQAGTVKKFSDLAGQARERSAQFKMNFPSIIENRMGRARSEARDTTATAQNQVRAGFNNRGLLFSGLRQGGEADAAQEVDGQLAQARTKIQDETQSAANQLDQDAIDAARQTAEIDSAYNDQNNEFRQALLDATMQRSQQNDELVGSLIGTGGNLLGMGAGGLLRKKKGLGIDGLDELGG